MLRDGVTWRRVGAALLDIVILGVAFALVSVVSDGAVVGDGEISLTLEGPSALAFAAIVLVYFFVGEAAAGRTPGKQLVGLRVVRTDGTPAGPGPILVRTLLRIVDQLPVLYLVGFIVMLVTGRQQRLGDLAAQTHVVAESEMPRARRGERG
ncbi:MAG: RDD family protein [Actinomycetota bacterium]|nr:RDD family protein [Actinomycetota bacterium]